MSNLKKKKKFKGVYPHLIQTIYNLTFSHTPQTCQSLILSQNFSMMYYKPISRTKAISSLYFLNSSDLGKAKVEMTIFSLIRAY